MRSAARAFRQLSTLIVVGMLLVPIIAWCGGRPASEGAVQGKIPGEEWCDISGFIESISATYPQPGPSSSNAAPRGADNAPPGKLEPPPETLPDPGGPPPETPPDPAEQPPDITNMEIDSASCDFDFDLFNRIASADPAANVVLSPFSVRMALAMAYNGADGAAKEAMAKVLGFEGLSLEEVNTLMYSLLSSLVQQGEEVQLEIANSFWGQEEFTFYDDITEACRDYYGAELQRVDFRDPEVVNLLNNWAKEKTHDKIPVIIPNHELIKDELFAWMNAVYFKAQWSSQFLKQNTKDEEFTLCDGQRVKVPMMYRSGKFRYLENEDFQAISLPYGDARMSMYVFLPKEGKDLKDLAQKLNKDDWECWINTFTRRDGEIFLPRLEVECGLSLNGTLKSMGMEAAFIDNALPKVVEAIDPMAIRTVMHKVVIEVNEEGTEGAAVTYVGGGAVSVPPPPPEPPFSMRVDRPFFFVIRDNQTGAILFMGSIADPS